MHKPIKIKFVRPQNATEFEEPYESQSLQTLACKHLPEHGGYTVILNGELIDPADWPLTIPGEGSQILFVPDMGDLAGFLAWAIPSIFGGLGAGATGWAAVATTVSNIIGYVGMSFLINSLMPQPKMPARIKSTPRSRQK